MNRLSGSWSSLEHVIHRCLITCLSTFLDEYVDLEKQFFRKLVKLTKHIALFFWFLDYLTEDNSINIIPVLQRKKTELSNNLLFCYI